MDMEAGRVEAAQGTAREGVAITFAIPAPSHFAPHLAAVLATAAKVCVSPIQQGIRTAAPRAAAPHRTAAAAAALGAASQPIGTTHTTRVLVAAAAALGAASQPIGTTHTTRVLVAAAAALGAASHAVSATHMTRVLVAAAAALGAALGVAVAPVIAANFVAPVIAADFGTLRWPNRENTLVTGRTSLTIGSLVPGTATSGVVGHKVVTRRIGKGMQLFTMGTARYATHHDVRWIREGRRGGILVRMLPNPQASFQRITCAISVPCADTGD